MQEKSDIIKTEALSKEEEEIVRSIRTVEYGHVEVEVRKGKPVIVRRTETTKLD